MSIGNINQMSLKEIEQELEWRQKVYPTLVGTLYPPIIRDEIGQLTRRKIEIESILRREKADNV